MYIYIYIGIYIYIYLYIYIYIDALWCQSADTLDISTCGIDSLWQYNY